MPRSLARTAVLAALTAALAAGATAPAFAVSVAPAPGTAECTNLVNVQTNVLAARETVADDTAALDAALRANPIVDATVNAARAKLAADQSNLANIVLNVTRSLCSGTPVRTTTPAPTTDPAPETTSPRVAPAPRIVVLPPVVVPAPTGTTTTSVIPTQDDGSVATTSGRQVTEVPSGSAQTGAA